jgi:hypothetical protein
MDQTATPNESHAQDVANIEAMAVEAGATAIGSVAFNSMMEINKILDLITSKIEGSKPDYSIQINGRNVYKGGLDGKGTHPLSEKQQQILKDAIYNPSEMKGTIRVRAKGVEKPVFEMVDGIVTQNKLSIEISAPTIKSPTATKNQPAEHTVVQGVATKIATKNPAVTNEDLLEEIKRLSAQVQALQQRLEPPQSASQKIGQWFNQTRNNVADKVHGLANKVHDFADKISVDDLQPIIEQAIAKGWERHNQSVEKGWENHTKALDNYAESFQPPIDAATQTVEVEAVSTPQIKEIAPEMPLSVHQRPTNVQVVDLVDVPLVKIIENNNAQRPLSDLLSETSKVEPIAQEIDRVVPPALLDNPLQNPELRKDMEPPNMAASIQSTEEILIEISEPKLKQTVTQVWNSEPTNMREAVQQMARVAPEPEKVEVKTQTLDKQAQQPSPASVESIEAVSVSKLTPSAQPKVEQSSRPSVAQTYLDTVVYPQIRSAITNYADVPNAIITLDDGTRQFLSRDYSFNDKPDGSMEVYRRITGERVSPENLSKIDRKVFDGIAKKLDKTFGPLDQRIDRPNIAKDKNLSVKQEVLTAAVAAQTVAPPKLRPPGLN